ncbi:hypothetical protein K440DRAFT_646318 [Wilcoxina mikolae CBS 423.85]|nr:hypothetical protein K440DRAFT_646318 [Wilcoxina mikolae CBS 423.85]
MPSLSVMTLGEHLVELVNALTDLRICRLPVTPASADEVLFHERLNVWRPIEDLWEFSPISRFVENKTSKKIISFIAFIPLAAIEAVAMPESWLGKPLSCPKIPNPQKGVRRCGIRLKVVAGVIKATCAIFLVFWDDHDDLKKFWSKVIQDIVMKDQNWIDNNLVEAIIDEVLNRRFEGRDSESKARQLLEMEEKYSELEMKIPAWETKYSKLEGKHLEAEEAHMELEVKILALNRNVWNCTHAF